LSLREPPPPLLAQNVVPIWGNPISAADTGIRKTPSTTEAFPPPSFEDDARTPVSTNGGDNANFPLSFSSANFRPSRLVMPPPSFFSVPLHEHSPFFLLPAPQPSFFLSATACLLFRTRRTSCAIRLSSLLEDFFPPLLPARATWTADRRPLLHGSLQAPTSLLFFFLVARPSQRAPSFFSAHEESVPDTCNKLAGALLFFFSPFSRLHDCLA